MLIIYWVNSNRCVCILIIFWLLLPVPAAKTGILDDSHLDVFKKQAACFGFPPDFHFGEATGKMLLSLRLHLSKHNRCSMHNLLSCLCFRPVPWSKGGRTVNTKNVEGTHLHLKSILRPEATPRVKIVFMCACVCGRHLNICENTF